MKVLLAAALLSAATFATVAVAQVVDKPAVVEPAMVSATSDTAADARTVASDDAVGVARRNYRAQCSRYESASFCECVTAGVAQALSPADVQVAARTIRERITAQGDAAGSGQTDPAVTGSDQMSRIEQAEGHYADACAPLRS